jgi:hypothetical protein
MDRILFGDNQFFAVSHISDERSRAQAVRFRDTAAVVRVLDDAINAGLTTFMCTTHDRIAEICEHIRSNPAQYAGFSMYPCMPYAHKYVNAVTELGIAGFLKEYVPGNLFVTLAKGGMALASKDFMALMEILVDSEMKMFRGIRTPVIFLQNVVTDLLLGLGMHDFFAAFVEYVKRKYQAEAGFITMNLPMVVDVLERVGVANPIVCASINKIGFRMPGGVEAYEKCLAEKSVRCIAMQVLAAGALRPDEAFKYVAGLKGVQSILFGASSKSHIEESAKMIREFSAA